MDFELIQRALPILLMGAGVTIEITAFSVAIGFFIGLFVGIARISQFKILQIMAAVCSEIFRAGIQAIDVGQMEAGRSLGLTWWQTMRFIILPQAFKNILPPLGNEFIAMLKDSSLVSVIGFEELTRRGQLIIAQTYGSFEIWMTVAVLYLIMTMAISRIVAFLEKR